MTHAELTDAVVVLVAGLAPLGLVVLAFVGFVLGPGRHIDRSRLRRSGSALLPEKAIAFLYWIVDPVTERMERLGIEPNQITLASMYLAVASGLLIALGHFMTGIWVFAFAAIADSLDGHLARRTGNGSDAGAFLDSYIDRLAEISIFGGLAWYGAGGPLTWVAVAAMVSSLLISYARARGEALGVDCAVGLMQRPERLVLLVLSVFLAPVGSAIIEPGAASPTFHIAIYGVGLLALLSGFTAFRRARLIYLALRDGLSSATEVGADSLLGEGKTNADSTSR